MAEPDNVVLVYLRHLSEQIDARIDRIERRLDLTDA
jgi:hypothetical protein